MKSETFSKKDEINCSYHHFNLEHFRPSRRFTEREIVRKFRKLWGANLAAFKQNSICNRFGVSVRWCKLGNPILDCSIKCFQVACVNFLMGESSEDGVRSPNWHTWRHLTRRPHFAMGTPNWPSKSVDHLWLEAFLKGPIRECCDQNDLQWKCLVVTWTLANGPSFRPENRNNAFRTETIMKCPNKQGLLSLEIAGKCCKQDRW